MSPKHSDKSIAEVVADPDAIPETQEPMDEEALENAEPTAIVSDNALRFVDPETIAYYPDITKAREDAQIPPHVSVKNLVDIPILIVTKRDQKAALPDTGELRDGFFCSCLYVESKKPFTTWFGQVALVRDLSQLTPPFRVTIVKHGRTYRFE